MSSTTVFISGATGFISQHICKQLLAKGYTVIGLVRSAAKGDNLAKLLGSDKFTYEVVSDIAVPGAFDEALKKHPEVTVFLHTAAAVALDDGDIEQKLLKPSIEGAKNALEAISAYGPNIKRVILTSSFAALVDLAQQNDSSLFVNEKSWNLVTYEQALLNGIAGYSAAKTFAEKAAWKFVEDKKPNWTLTTINPVFAFGPQAFDENVMENLNVSAEIVNSILKSKPDEILNEMRSFFVDVRDVAQNHVDAITKEGAAGKRIISSKGEFVIPQMIDIITKKFPSVKGQIASKTTTDESNPAGLLHLCTEASWKLMGEPKYSLEESVYDLVEQILRVTNA